VFDHVAFLDVGSFHGCWNRKWGMEIREWGRASWGTCSQSPFPVPA
jgi:hypothetical protein